MYFAVVKNVVMFSHNKTVILWIKSFQGHGKDGERDDRDQWKAVWEWKTEHQASERPGESSRTTTKG